MREHITFNSSRRLSLSCAVALVFNPSLKIAKVLVPISGLFAANQAKALDPVTIAMTAQVAASVTGMLAKRKQGPSQEIILLSASLDYQRAMLNQLASLQAGMAEIITQLAQIKESIRIVVDRTLLAKTQQDMLVVAAMYQQEVDRIPNSGYDNWRKSPYTQEKLTAMAYDIDKISAVILAKDRLDVLTSLQLPSVMFAAIGVWSALDSSGQRSRDIAQRFLDLMEKASNPNISGSLAQELNSWSNARSKSISSLVNVGLKVPFASETALVPLGRINVTHYFPAEPPVQYRCPRRGGGGGRGPREGDTGGDNYCERPGAPERPGETSSFAFDIPVERIFIRAGSGDAGNGVFQYVINAGVRVNSVGFQTDAPSEKANAPSVTHRRDIALTSPEGLKLAMTRLDQLRVPLASFNEESAYCALHFSALASLADARQRVMSFFGVKT